MGGAFLLSAGRRKKRKEERASGYPAVTRVICQCARKEEEEAGKGIKMSLCVCTVPCPMLISTRGFFSGMIYLNPGGRKKMGKGVDGFLAGVQQSY